MSLSKLSKLSIRAIVFAICAVFLVAAAHAQYRASIQGVVADAQGAVVDGATITLTAKETGISKTTTSDSSGVYAFSGLAPGRYSLVVEKTGFKKEVLDDVVVIAEQANSVNVQLQVGQVSESVTVSSEVAPAIDTETGNIAGTLTSSEIQNLPSFGRDPYQLARLAPGVFGDGATNGDGNGRGLPGSNQSSSGSTGSIFMTENQPQIVAGGTRNNGNSYQVDGVEVNSLAWGGSAVITPNEEAVKEVQIQANPYSAENGRNSGAQVLVVTKNGTNNFHGSAFMKVHRPGLDAYQRWNGPFPGPTAPYGHQRDINRFNQFGGSIGGPIFKNKLFFFYSMEQLRNVVFGTGPSGWYETPQFDALAASNSSSIAAKFTTYPGNAIQFTQINQVDCSAAGRTEGTNCVTVKDSSGKIIGLNVGSPTNAPLGTQSSSSLGGGLCNGTTIPCTPDIFNVQVVQSDRNIATQYNGRLDYQATSKDLVAFSTFWVPNDHTNFYNGTPRKYDLWASNRLNYSPTVLWDHTVNANLLNEARFNVTRWWFNEAKSNPQIPFGFPTLSILDIGLGEWGNNTCPFCGFFGPAGPGIFYQTTYNVRDTLTKIHKSHALKFGADIYKEQDNDETPWNGIPSYNFNNLWDFANDAPNLEGGDFDPRTGTPQDSIKHIRSNIYAFFVQDDYKLRPNLTLNLGLRWEYFGPIHEKRGNLSTAILGSGTSTLTGLQMRVGGNMYNSSYHNFGPQIGLAWSPRGAFGHDFNNRFVVRGGFGMAYNRLQEAVTLNGRFNIPLDVEFSVAPWGTALTGSNIFYAVANNPKDFTTYPSNPHTIETFDPTTNLPTCAPATCAAPAITAFDHNMLTPTVYRYSAEGQYDLGSRWVATVGYQGSLSKNFTRQIPNLNLLYPNNLNPAVGGVDFYTNDADGHYNAMLMRVEHQFAKNYQFDAQYMYSSCMDHGSQDYFVYQPYPFTVGPSWGHCDYDAKHSFKAFGVWSPRIFRGANDWREKVVGGWELSGIYSFHTGFPFSPYFGAPVVNGQVVPAAYTGGAGSGGNAAFEKAFGNFSQLASITCSNAAPCTSIPYFGIPTLTAAGGIPPLPGLQRNLFRGPGFHQFDLTMRKDFGLTHIKGLGEGARISIRADMYNLFNTLNLSPISGPVHLGDLAFNSTTNTTTVTGLDNSFGRSGGALGARVVEFTFRFQF